MIKYIKKKKNFHFHLIKMWLNDQYKEFEINSKSNHEFEKLINVLSTFKKS